MRVRSSLVAVLSAGALSGCAEGVLIRSSPMGAKAYVDGEFIGTTPARTAIPRNAVGNIHRWRVEHRNCEPIEGELKTDIGPGRIVGYVFSLGVSALFKGPRYFHRVDAALICQQEVIFRPSEGVENAQRLTERLKTLRDLRDRGLISAAEFEQERQKAIRELAE